MYPKLSIKDGKVTDVKVYDTFLEKKAGEENHVASFKVNDLCVVVSNKHVIDTLRKKVVDLRCKISEAEGKDKKRSYRQVKRLTHKLMNYEKNPEGFSVSKRAYELVYPSGKTLKCANKAAVEMFAKRAAKRLRFAREITG